MLKVILAILLFCHSELCEESVNEKKGVSGFFTNVQNGKMIAGRKFSDTFPFELLPSSLSLLKGRLLGINLINLLLYPSFSSVCFVFLFFLLIFVLYNTVL